MQDFNIMDEIGCEEFYYEELDLWMEELQTDWINGELQVIADEIRGDETDF